MLIQIVLVSSITTATALPVNIYRATEGQAALQPPIAVVQGKRKLNAEGHVVNGLLVPGANVVSRRNREVLWKIQKKSFIRIRM